MDIFAHNSYEDNLITTFVRRKATYVYTPFCKVLKIMSFARYYGFYESSSEDECTYRSGPASKKQKEDEDEKDFQEQTPARTPIRHTYHCYEGPMPLFGATTPLDDVNEPKRTEVSRNHSEDYTKVRIHTDLPWKCELPYYHDPAAHGPDKIAPRAAISVIPLQVVSGLALQTWYFDLAPGPFLFDEESMILENPGANRFQVVLDANGNPSTIEREPETPIVPLKLVIKVSDPEYTAAGWYTIPLTIRAFPIGSYTNDSHDLQVISVTTSMADNTEFIEQRFTDNESDPFIGSFKATAGDGPPPDIDELNGMRWLSSMEYGEGGILRMPPDILHDKYKKPFINMFARGALLVGDSTSSNKTVRIFNGHVNDDIETMFQYYLDVWFKNDEPDSAWYLDVWRDPSLRPDPFNTYGAMVRSFLALRQIPVPRTVPFDNTPPPPVSGVSGTPVVTTVTDSSIPLFGLPFAVDDGDEFVPGYLSKSYQNMQAPYTMKFGGEVTGSRHRVYCQMPYFWDPQRLIDFTSGARTWQFLDLEIPAGITLGVGCESRYFEAVEDTSPGFSQYYPHDQFNRSGLHYTNSTADPVVVRFKWKHVESNPTWDKKCWLNNRFNFSVTVPNTEIKIIKARTLISDRAVVQQVTASALFDSWVDEASSFTLSGALISWVNTSNSPILFRTPPEHVLPEFEPDVSVYSPPISTLIQGTVKFHESANGYADRLYKLDPWGSVNCGSVTRPWIKEADLLGIKPTRYSLPFGGTPWGSLVGFEYITIV